MARLLLVACLSTAFCAVADGRASTETAATTILRAAQVDGGFVVHLGCGDGRITAALHGNDRFTVHGLDTDAAKVAEARKYVQSQGLYGPVSVERFSASSLPYADNLINLVVVDTRWEMEDTGSEILRVLAPRGVAVVREMGNEAWLSHISRPVSRIGNGFVMFTKPVPAKIDEWSHFLHDASNNAVAKDEMVGQPRSLQWVAPPLWLRSHETPSGFQAMVSASGRVFYFFDEGLIGLTDQRLPERWSLVCRDAFNGKLLWKRDLKSWGWPEWARERFEGQDWTAVRGGRTVVPDENHRRLVADGQRVYATLGYQAPLSILDASTGDILTTVEETEPVKEFVVSDGVVVVYSIPLAAETSKRRQDQVDVSATLTGIKDVTGKVLWKHNVQPIPSLFLAVDDGRVVYQNGSKLTCRDLGSGDQLWEVPAGKGKGKTLLIHNGVIVVYIGNAIEAREATTGRSLWKQSVPPSSGSESPDVFVADGIVWRGMIPVDEELKAAKKSEDAMTIGLDLRTGEEKHRIVVHQLRSPEHHHRCYRNKATERYIISGMEGAEFLDLKGDDHGQNNWLRGACKLGVMPCNGLLYVPPDQCFCQPGAKILGFTALAAERSRSKSPEPKAGQRLERGPAYEKIGDPQSETAGPDDWPTYRHDSGRHGSTSSKVATSLGPCWRTRLGGALTAPVAVADKVYVASSDSHTVHALDIVTGKSLWQYVAGGRIDSPPTVYRGLVLFGSADGQVYCLRAKDGTLVWRFLAAPADRRIGCFDQFESVWPVHGSVLVREGVAYVTAGRSTYLDGGIHVYALEPMTGAVLHQATLEGPFPDVKKGRDYAFYLLGSNSDVLVSEGDHVYLRQKKLTHDLREEETPVLSSKGERDVGLHVFSTSGLLDGSWYNRTYWMYSKRWPGFQLANQAPKTGQLLVADEANTYAVRVFYRRNVHSPMFFPEKEGYLLFADRNTTEPQIVGEPGAKDPVRWLPQSDYLRGRGDEVRTLDSEAFGLDKMIGYTRAEAPLWMTWLRIRVRAMVKAGDAIFVAGPPDLLDESDPYAAFEGRKGAKLAAISAKDGTKLADFDLGVPPEFDGMIAARGRLFLALRDGSLACYTEASGGH